MERLSLKELAVPIIKAVDSFNFLLKAHHRHVALISYYLGKELKLSDDDLLRLIIAASLHDVGALSVQERDMLIKEDVTNPGPHCTMGWCMLSGFAAFADIAKIVKHHHVKYEESLSAPEGEIPFQCHIIHLADRVDILISPDEFVLNQKATVKEKIRANTGTVFHPEVYAAFEQVSKADIFWIEINDVPMDQLFSRINFSLDFELTLENVMEFSMTMSRLIDFRSRYTASHSYTVANLANLIAGFFGFPEERRQKLMVAGYLHDIGKLGIDPGLIEKPGPLTANEYNLIKLHTYYTGQILGELSKSEWFGEIVDCSVRHHEKADGTGYPYALDNSGLNDNIKILAFSDIISALMEERPYRKGLPVDVAFDIMEKQLAPHVSMRIYAVIDRHRAEIDEMVKECQAHTIERYRLGTGEA